MSAKNSHNYPKLHNAMWPGLVGKGSDGAEPVVDLDTMLNLTAAGPRADGVKFDAASIFSSMTRTSISTSPTTTGKKAPAGKIADKGFVVGSVVAPVWFDGSAMGDAKQVRRENISPRRIRSACRIAKTLRASWGFGPTEWFVSTRHRHRATGPKDPAANQKMIADTFKQAAAIDRDHGETPGRRGRDLLGRNALRADQWSTYSSRVNEPDTLGFQADMASHAALHAGRKRSRRSDPCPRDMIGRTEPCWTRPSKS